MARKTCPDESERMGPLKSACGEYECPCHDKLAAVIDAAERLLQRHDSGNQPCSELGRVRCDTCLSLLHILVVARKREGR